MTANQKTFLIAWGLLMASLAISHLGQWGCVAFCQTVPTLKALSAQKQGGE